MIDVLIEKSSKIKSATMEELTNHSTDLKMLAEQLGNEINKFKTN